MEDDIIRHTLSKIIRQRQKEEPTILKNGAPEILYKGFIAAMVKLPVLIDKGDGYLEKDFQRFIHPPGVRVIAIKDSKILLTKEFRHELNEFDYRLPGGKVFDSIEVFLLFVLTEKDVSENLIMYTARNELREEDSKNAQSFTILRNPTVVLRLVGISIM